MNSSSAKFSPTLWFKVGDICNGNTNTGLSFSPSLPHPNSYGCCQLQQEVLNETQSIVVSSLCMAIPCIGALWFLVAYCYVEDCNKEVKIQLISVVFCKSMHGYELYFAICMLNDSHFLHVDASLLPFPPYGRGLLWLHLWPMLFPRLIWKWAIATYIPLISTTHTLAYRQSHQSGKKTFLIFRSNMFSTSLFCEVLVVVAFWADLLFSYLLSM